MNFDLKEEVRCGFTVTQKRKRVWQVELEMLQELDRVCKKYNLMYFADSGTLLGTIRNKGFIPWDDDMDFVMPRKDYDKLVKIANKEIKSPLFFQSAYSDEGYYRGHAQLRNSNTTGILPKEGINVTFNQGIFIDIFPLDYVSKSKIIEKYRHHRLKRFMNVFRILFNKKKSEKAYKEKGKEIIRGFYKNKDKKKMYSKYEKIASRVMFKSANLDKVSYYANVCKYKYFPDEYFSKVIYMDFENTKIPVPHRYKDILEAYYGKNYMEPQNKISHHGKVIYEVDKNYEDVLNEIRKGKKYENFEL